MPLLLVSRMGINVLPEILQRHLLSVSLRSLRNLTCSCSNNRVQTSVEMQYAQVICEQRRPSTTYGATSNVRGMEVDAISVAGLERHQVRRRKACQRKVFTHPRGTFRFVRKLDSTQRLFPSARSEVVKAELRLVGPGACHMTVRAFSQ